jgi:tellurium resistance protein TerD
MLMAVITIYDDNFMRGRGTPPVNFGKVQNASVRLYDNVTGQALYQFDLTADAAAGTAVEMACIYRRENDWEFTALGKIAGTSPNGLEDIIAKYSNS